MSAVWNLRNIQKLYENKKYKQITDLFSFVIKVDKTVNKPILNRIFFTNRQVFSLSAIYWNINKPQKYKRISSCIKIGGEKEINITQIRKYLTENIYKAVIKKEIMML